MPFERAVVSQGVLGIARHVENLQFRMRWCQMFRDLGTAYPWQNDIGQQQMKAAMVLTTKLQRLLAVGSLQHHIAYVLKDLSHQVADDRFILDQQDGFTSVR